MRLYNLPNDEIPFRFAGKQEGYNKEKRFRSELNAGRWTAYSFEMPIAYWNEDKILTPLVDSSFNLTASVTTKGHIDAILHYFRRQDEHEKIVTFIPELYSSYDAGEGARNNHPYADTVEFQYLMMPLKDGALYSKSSWKTERGAYNAALLMVDGYSHYINFRGMDVCEYDEKDWRVVLEYSALELK